MVPPQRATIHTADLHEVHSRNAFHVFPRRGQAVPDPPEVSAANLDPTAIGNRRTKEASQPLKTGERQRRPFAVRELADGRGVPGFDQALAETD